MVVMAPASFLMISWILPYTFHLMLVIFSALSFIIIKDSAEKITSIKWNVYGKIQEIIKNDAGAITTIKYTYDALGNRISQTVIPPAGGAKVYTWYVRD